MPIHKIKYVVIPDWVTSINDGERHYINAHQLMNLYKVNPRECVIQHGDQRMIKNFDKLIPLRPRYNGDYTLRENNEILP